VADQIVDRGNAELSRDLRKLDSAQARDSSICACAEDTHFAFMPRSFSQAAWTCPNQRKLSAICGNTRGWPGGRMTEVPSNHGPARTAPPPVARLHRAMPSDLARSAMYSSGRCARPNTTAGRAQVHLRTHGSRTGLSSIDAPQCCSSSAVSDSTETPAGFALNEVPTLRASWRAAYPWRRFVRREPISDR
jgi:hypothetical protein